MEWLEFPRWSAQVTRAMTALNASMSTQRARRTNEGVVRLDPRAAEARWRELLRQWPAQGLFAQWVDAEEDGPPASR